MDKAQTKRNMKHWGIVSTRLAGTDGVSLEAAKWANVFEEEGLSCFYFAGELDRPQERSYLAPEAHFTHPKVQEIQRVSFGVIRRDRSLSQKIHELSHILKDHLYAFIEKFDIGLLLVENALFCLIVFLLSYLLVMTEEQTHLRKSKPVMLGAGIIWMVIGIAAPEYNVDHEQLKQAIFHDL